MVMLSKTRRFVIMPACWNDPLLRETPYASSSLVKASGCRLKGNHKPDFALQLGLRKC